MVYIVYIMFHQGWSYIWCEWNRLYTQTSFTHTKCTFNPWWNMMWNSLLWMNLKNKMRLREPRVDSKLKPTEFSEIPLDRGYYLLRKVGERKNLDLDWVSPAQCPRDGKTRRLCYFWGFCANFGNSNANLCSFTLIESISMLIQGVFACFLILFLWGKKFWC